MAQVVKNLPAMQETWVGKIPWRRKWQPTPVFLPGKSHQQRSLVGSRPWVYKELDTTRWLNDNKNTSHKMYCFSRFPGHVVEQPWLSSSRPVSSHPATPHSPLHPCLRQPLIFFLSPWICLFWIFHIHEIRYRVAFGDWLLSLSIMVSRLSHVVGC